MHEIKSIEPRVLLGQLRSLLGVIFVVLVLTLITAPETTLIQASPMFMSKNSMKRVPSYCCPSVIVPASGSSPPQSRSASFTSLSDLPLHLAAAYGSEVGLSSSFKESASVSDFAPASPEHFEDYSLCQHYSKAEIQAACNSVYSVLEDDSFVRPMADFMGSGKKWEEGVSENNDENVEEEELTYDLTDGYRSAFFEFPLTTLPPRPTTPKFRPSPPSPSTKPKAKPVELPKQVEGDDDDDQADDMNDPRVSARLSCAVTRVLVNYVSLVTYLNQTGNLDERYQLFHGNDFAHPTRAFSPPTPLFNEGITSIDSIVNQLETFLRSKYPQQAPVPERPEVIKELAGLEFNLILQDRVESHPIEFDPSVNQDLPSIHGLQSIHQMICFVHMIEESLREVDEIVTSSKLWRSKLRKAQNRFLFGFTGMMWQKLDGLAEEFPALGEVYPNVMASCMIAHGVMDEISVVLSTKHMPMTKYKDWRGRAVHLLSVMANLNFKTPLSLLASTFGKSPDDILSTSGFPALASYDDYDFLYFLPDLITGKGIKEYLTAIMIDKITEALVSIANLVRGTGVKEDFILFSTLTSYVILSLLKDGMVEMVDYVLRKSMGLALFESPEHHETESEVTSKKRGRQ